MTTVQGAAQHYFSEFLPIPDKLTDVFASIKLLMVERRQSSFSHMQRRQLLLDGTSTKAVFARFVEEVHPTFPDCQSVARHAPAMTKYLDRLIAPDEMAAARDLIAERLGIGERNEIADDLETLNHVAPEIVSALLELRIGRAERLFDDSLFAVECDAERETLDGYRHLSQSMARVRIAYLLRCEAMKAAARIHAHFGWSVLDDLESSAIGGSLRVVTLLDRVERELALVEYVVAVYRNSTTVTTPPACLLRKAAPTVSAETVLPASLRFLDAMDIERRAHVQQAIWRMEHGTALEMLVRAQADDISKYLVRMRTSIETYRYNHGNTLVTNLGHVNAGAQLYLATREAVAWARESTSVSGVNAETSIALVLKAINKHGTARRYFRFPKVDRDDANTIDELFVIYRFAFLQDNEVLPPKLRRVTDPKTGVKTNVKTHERAAKVLGRRYTFDEQWDEWKRSMAAKRAKLPAKPTKQQEHQARQIDLAAKRDALKIIKRRNPTRRSLRGAFDRRNGLRTGIIHGFLAV